MKNHSSLRIVLCMTLAITAAAFGRGGGGCFLPDTPILCADGTEVPIREIRAGDELLAFTSDERIVHASVNRVLTRVVDEYAVVTTARLALRVTLEHPFYVGNGAFKTLETLKVGDSVFVDEHDKLGPQLIVSLERIHTQTLVFNLQTDFPNTFFANGVAVHNKGGGVGGGGGGGGGHFGGGGSYHGGGGGGGNPVFGLLFLGLWIWMLVATIRRLSRQAEDLDFVYSRSAIEKKSAKTLKLLEFIAKTDTEFTPAKLTGTTQTVFCLLQQCWGARDYAPMKNHMMPDLFADHLSQIAGMIRNHEINKIDQLTVETIDIVNVRYTQKENEREFIALVTASARDYYVDDRTGGFLRGDASPAQFQEFWTFHRMNGSWLLREIDQSRESDALKEENFFEPFTDTGRDQVYGETAGKEGPIGPWLEKETETKASRTERLLNFLFQTDKLWDRQAMLTLARQVFTHVKMAWESGNAAMVSPSELFPDTFENLKKGIDGQRARGITVEYRNFCVRKVELILVRNFADNMKDDFTVRISAHAQKIAKKNGQILSEDADVAPFKEYWTFGRLDNQWKLKEVLPPAKGKGMIGQENIDEESNPDQLEWYYRQTRAV